MSHLSYSDHTLEFKSLKLTSVDEVCLSSFVYTVTIRLNKLERNKEHDGKHVFLLFFFFIQFF